ncbi:MAG: right-handed parallel beta-helix repeat-containing protein [Labilithrix sp.]|nr:right-handed parallel beta-helix repeat-containing protein [Labilithrix sp.]
MKATLLVLVLPVVGCASVADEPIADSTSALTACGARLVATTGSDLGDCRSRPCRTIQRAVDVACAGDVVRVDRGEYDENVVVRQSVAIQGERRRGRTLVRPAFSAPNPCADSSLCDGAASSVFLVTASRVTLQDLVIDGDNPLLTSGVVVGGADIDARNGIIQDTASGPLDGLTVTRVVVRNVFRRGIFASSGGAFSFRDNRVRNVRGDASAVALFTFGGTGEMSGNEVVDANDALAANHSRGVSFRKNRVSRSGSGVHTDNAGEASTEADRIEDNRVEDCTPGGYGIFVFAPYLAPSVVDNEVERCTVGFAAFGQGLPVRAAFTGNESDRNRIGFYVTDDLPGFGSTDVAITIEDNRIRRAEVGLWLDRRHGDVVDADVRCNTITDGATGIASSTASGRIESNAIFDNGLGLDAHAAIDARDNWWGCKRGPLAGSSCDAVRGPAVVAPFLARRPGCTYRPGRRSWSWKELR